MINAFAMIQNFIVMTKIHALLYFLFYSGNRVQCKGPWKLNTELAKKEMWKYRS